MDITIVNKFAEGAENVAGSSISVRNRTPSPKPGGIIRVRTPTDLCPHVETLSNRVSFFMDDEMEMPVLSRELSLRQERRRPKLMRHHSDVSSMRKSKNRMHRKRSARSKPVVRHESLEHCQVKVCTRCGSVRCKGTALENRPASLRIKRDNSSSLRMSTRSTVSKHSSSSVKLPRKDLPPKERKRRIVVMVVVITCLFLVSCSVLVVILTLTHSAFYNKSYGVMELNDVRNHNTFYHNSNQRNASANNISSTVTEPVVPLSPPP